MKQNYIYGKKKERSKAPEIICSRRRGKNNIVLIINGDASEESEQIKQELMPVIQKMYRKHKLGYALVKLHGHETRLFKIFQLLFNFN